MDCTQPGSFPSCLIIFSAIGSTSLLYSDSPPSQTRGPNSEAMMINPKMKRNILVLDTYLTCNVVQKTRSDSSCTASFKKRTKFFAACNMGCCCRSKVYEAPEKQLDEVVQNPANVQPHSSCESDTGQSELSFKPKLDKSDIEEENSLNGAQKEPDRNGMKAKVRRKSSVHKYCDSAQLPSSHPDESTDSKVGSQAGHPMGVSCSINYSMSAMKELEATMYGLLAGNKSPVSLHSPPAFSE